MACYNPSFVGGAEIAFMRQSALLAHHGHPVGHLTWPHYQPQRGQHAAHHYYVWTPTYIGNWLNRHICYFPRIMRGVVREIAEFCYSRHLEWLNRWTARHFLAKAVKAFKPDVIVFHTCGGFPPFDAVYFYEAAHALGVPTVVVMHTN